MFETSAPAPIFGASDARMAAILETALDAIIVMDHTGCVRDWNPAAERTFGYTREEVLGREMAELIIPPFLRERHRQGLAHAVATGHDTIAGRRIEITAMRRDGEEFPVELAITRIAGGDSVPLFAGHIRDITERRRSEQRQAAQSSVALVLAVSATLAEAAPRILRAVCDGLNWDFGALWSNEGGALHCVEVWHPNPAQIGEFSAATRRLAFAPGEGLPGRIWKDVAPVWIPDVTRDTNFPRAEIAAQCGLHGAFGFPIRLGEKVLGVVEFFSSKIRQPDEELLEMFAGIGAQIGQFIERRRAEAELRALNVELERRVDDRTKELGETNARLLTALENEQEVGRLKSSFVSLVSHEFRTPLGIILSSSEILHLYFASLAEPERREHLDAIKGAVLRMSALMEGVLFFSRVEADKLECVPAPLDLAELCQHLRDEACSATSERCPIEWKQQNDLTGARGDEELLRHIISNLLSNAVKYSADGNPIIFSARREKNDAMIEISDHGLGIPANAMPQLFTAFYRGSNVSGLPGTGLGLSIVKKCVDLHGGEIALESTEGIGTIARVRLPLFNSHSSATRNLEC